MHTGSYFNYCILYVVIAPPEVTVSPDMLVRGFNEEGTFVCKGFGLPAPTLTWSNEMGMLTSNDEFSISEGTETNIMGYTVSVLNLTLLDTNERFEGSYICEGINNIENFINSDETSEGTFHIEGMKPFKITLKI